jgi:Spy/CpxP family protein refolding chaperone
MKKKIFLPLMSLLFLGSMAQAQTFKDELEIVKTIWGKEKKALATDLLKLNAEESAKFGTIYEEYLAARKKVTDVRVGALETFAKANAQLDDATASKMVNSLMKNNSNLAKLQSKTFNKLSKALSPVKAAQWWQMESYIDAEIRAALLSELPLVEGIKK